VFLFICQKLYDLTYQLHLSSSKEKKHYTYSKHHSIL